MTITLKRSLKRIAEAAEKGGWSVSLGDDHASFLELVMTLPPAPDMPEPTRYDHLTRRRLAAAEVVVRGAIETGAYYGASVRDANGDSVGIGKLDKVEDVVNLLGFRNKYLADWEAAARRAASDRLREAERAAIRERFVEELSGDYRYRAVAEIAEREVELPNVDITRDNHYWAAGRFTSYLTEVLAKRMAARALDIVGWPSSGPDRSEDLGTPIALGTALAKAVGEVIGHESSSSTNFEALARAAKEVLRYA